MSFGLSKARASGAGESKSRSPISNTGKNGAVGSHNGRSRVVSNAESYPKFPEKRAGATWQVFKPSHGAILEWPRHSKTFRVAVGDWKAMPMAIVEVAIQI